VNYKKGIIVNLFLLILLLLLTFILFHPEEKGDLARVESKTFPLVRQNVADITAVAIINDNARFGLIHKEGTLTLEPHQPDTLLSDEKMQSFLFRLSKLSGLAKIKAKNDLTPYGLDSSKTKGTIFLKNGGKIRLFLGKQNQLDKTYYIRRESDEAIYLIAEADADLILSDPSDFTVNQVLPRLDLKNLNSLKSIEVSSPRQALPSFKVENQGNFIFGITEPFASTLDYERVLSDLIFPVLFLAPDQKGVDTSSLILPESEDLRLRINLDDHFYELIFFRKEDGAVFLTRKGFSKIFELKDEAAPFMNLHYLDLLNDSIYHSNISEIKSIVVQDLESKTDYNIDITGESVNLKGDVNGLSVDYPKMMELFEVLLQTGIAHELPKEKKLNQKHPVSLRILIYKKNGSIDRLDFSSTENQEEILFINGTAHFTTYYKTVLDIKKALSDLFD
jgi:hypothetical protein